MDAIEAVPRTRHRYLVIGVRSFDAQAPGALPRRYAFVMEVGAEGPRLVRGTFLVGAARRDMLLLQAPEPSMGDFRLHSFGRRHLAFSADDGALRLISFDEGPRPGAAHRRPDVATVARWENGLFRVHGRSWYASVESPGDARTWISDRWGGIAEIGERDFDEILGMRADGVGAPPASRRAASTRAAIGDALDLRTLATAGGPGPAR